MKSVLAILTSKVFYGKERSNVEVYHLLQKNGLKVHVVINKEAESRLKRALIGLNVVEIDCPDRHDRSKSFLRYIIGVVKTNRFLKKLLKTLQPDYLFINNEFSMYDFNWAIKSFTGKIVYRLGDAPAYPGLRFYWFNSRVWNDIAVKRVDKFVCISNFIKQKLIDTGRTSHQDSVIYNYPPTREQKGKEDLLYTRQTDDFLIFGYIGQIIETKGVAHYIAAARKILQQYPNCVFLVAGNLEYDKKFGDKIRQIVSSGLEDKVHLLGEVDNIEAFYKSLDVLCVPSIKQEPLGNIIVEAKKFSKPCIIYPSGGMPELINHLRDGYVCEFSEEQALYEGMLWYCDHQSVIAEHSGNSFASIRQLGIDRESFEKKWKRVFEV